MRRFDYSSLPERLRSPELVAQLLALRELKGRQGALSLTSPRILESLREGAVVQSTGASNRIEGIVTTERRLHGIVSGSVAPRNRDEQEIAGYRDVLGLIHERHDYINVTPSVILQLHRDMMRHTPSSFGGRWKDSDNVIVARDPSGNPTVRFRPMPASLTPSAMEALCSAYRDAVRGGVHDPLLLSMLFVFDFVSIHPFNDGNGRMSRLLTVLLMERCGYEVPRYVSIERGVEASKGQYYEVLAASSVGWMEGENDASPFVSYMLAIITGAYRRLFELAGGTGAGAATKAGRVAAVFERRLGKVTKRDIREECPDISDSTIERELRRLLDEGAIEKVGGGRSTGYVRQT